MRSWTPFTIFLAVVAALGVFTTVASDIAYAKPRPGATPFTMSDSIAACDEVLRSSTNPINCVVIDVRGHPTLAVEFANEPSMNTYLGEFSKRVAAPFCESANKDNQSAFFVVALKTPRVGSVSWCETGESTDWVSIDNLEYP